MKVNLFSFLGLSVISTLLLMPLTGVPAQTHAGTHHARSVTLDTIFSCLDDQMLKEVFKTDAYTARFELQAIKMTVNKTKKADDIEYAVLRSKGFYTDNIDDTNLSIMPTDYRGDLIEQSKLPFCHDNPVAMYGTLAKKDDYPYSIRINAEDWSFNSNELFAHADQFKFKSGVFSNGTQVFFMATRESVSIQFLCTDKGLKFYRVFYDAKS